MNKLKMQTENIVDENIDFIGTKFPNCIVEAKDESGKTTKMVDFDLLKQELSKVVVDGDKERYTMNWPNKKQAILTANSPVAMTLRPCKEKSVNYDDTKNIYIEGDNLDVLKVLRETYLGKVKMIYIDPPYNTGNDFVYNDDFATNTEDYLARSNQIDIEGNRMVSNNESNGRFHTDWLNMIYPRIKVAKDLLTDDGVIFISIDDNEKENLKKICEEIFGENNFIAQVVWKRAFSPVNLKKHFSESHDYILCYAKNIENTNCNGLPRTSDANDRYANPDNDPRGVWTSGDLSVGPAVESSIYEITLPSGRKVLPPSGRCWRVSKENFEKELKDNRIWFGEDGDGVPRYKRFLSEVKQSMTPMTVWDYTEVGHSQDAKKKLNALFDGKALFDYPKSVDLIKRCIQLYSDKESIILDFFSGSATTAHAIFQLNAEDNGNRKFICVQLPELCEEKSEAFKTGYKTICEIGEERIRRAGRKIKEENQMTAPGLDVGFRVFKLDSSNMKDTYYKPADYSLNLLDQLDENIKPDRTPEDLLFQVMLDLGLMLDSKIEEKNINGKKVFVVGEYNDYVSPDLICCFDSNVDNNTVTEIAKMKPRFSVFRDSSMSRDSVAVNFDQIFETYSPSTTRKVL